MRTQAFAFRLTFKQLRSTHTFSEQMQQISDTAVIQAFSNPAVTL